MSLIKEKKPSNEKIVVCNLAKMNPAIFLPILVSKKELKESEFCVAGNGKLYINSKGDFCKVLTEIFNILIPAQRYELENLRKQYKAQFPKVKNIQDIKKVEDGMKYHAFVYFMIPAELKRRDIERSYYKRAK